MLRLALMLLLLVGTVGVQAQKRKQKEPKKPRLVVGIVVDQMRYDYLYRYQEQYTDGGFKRLLREGFNFRNTNYNYVPTYTGPGHASIYTGTTPAIHGIVGNDWYVRGSGKTTYCTDDAQAECVGTASDAGKMSPANLLTTTITDELRLGTNMRSRVFGVCLKDRGAILPAGHTGNAAYWYHGATGEWISSTFYMQELPQWVKAFNARRLPEHYLSQPWNLLLPKEQYTQSTADDVPWEGLFAGETKPVFPHEVQQLRGQQFDILRSTPAGNTFTKEFAKELIRAEKLGKGTETDFLALSFSSTDYIGHQYGPNAMEMQDTYLRLDRDLEDLLTFLDQYLGKENVLVFLTADHGAAHAPAYLQQLKIPAGVHNKANVLDSLQQYLVKTYGPGKWVEYYINQQVYLDHALIEARKLSLAEVQERAAAYLLRFAGIARTVTATALNNGHWASGPLSFVEKGFYPKRSGDVMVLLEPAWFEGWGGTIHVKGTTHGHFARYDTHVPLLWYGWKIPAGESAYPAYITDIAPTLAYWLNLQQPNGTMGQPLQQEIKPVLKR